MATPGPVFNSENYAGGTNNNINGNVIYMISEDKVDKEKIYRWLDAPDSSGNFLAAREKHHGKTGAWFIEGDEYITWKKTPDSALWVYGTPGCGKTIICSIIIEKICEECSATPTFAYAYFFFDARDGQTDLSLHDRLIRSIIKQLSYQSSGFPTSLVELYGDGRQPSIKALQHVLEKIIDGFDRTYIIIDAVDECANREKVLTWIDKITRRKAGNLQVLFSSRPERDIKDYLDSMVSLYRVTLNGKRADRDIEAYLDAMLAKMTRWDAVTIARVRAALITGSDGMFRWVALQISELLKCRTRKAVNDQLQNLPKDLEGMYEKELLKSPHRQDLKRFLIWLAFSARPLYSGELAEVATVDFSPSGLPSYNPDLQYFGTEDMLVTCSSFVSEITVSDFSPIHIGGVEFTRIVKLAHMSIKDYLVSGRIKAGEASYFGINAMLSHSLITKTCLAYIFHLRSLHSINDSVLKSVPLGDYAAKYWIKHMQLGGGEDAHLPQMMHSIFTLEENALANWVRLVDLDISRSFRMQPVATAAPLYYACIYDLTHTARLLLIGGAAVNMRGGRCGTALLAASDSGHEDIVRLLLEHGADDIVRLLLEHGANVDTETALLAALSHGHLSTVRVLLGRGVQVSDPERWLASVKLLFEHGVFDEDYVEDGSDSGEGEDGEEQDDEGDSNAATEGDDSSAETKEDDSSAGRSSEDEWASAQEDAGDA
ncbi:ankyrin [Athelia psychrophila]|uniref:Ankyrin n=1 Tax=Athelia psychrophila TaxID=1759441 RepID=A0A166MIA8_9AGAM|nr:ankyrin [Fibularhizoctonia sp. CBS 109695]